MSDKVAQIQQFLHPDEKAAWVRHLWTSYNNERVGWLREKQELRDFIFATDTTKTEAGKLPWKNSTTLPKLCQIRDNLHSNYLQALIPNDKAFQWVAYTEDAAKHDVAKTITAYIENKAREGGLRSVISDWLYDYIDYGNVFGTVAFESRYKVTDKERVADFIGPKGVRISPLDIVFNPTANSFDDSFKVIRSMKTVGELKKLAATEPEYAFFQEAVDRREEYFAHAGAWASEDWEKAEAYYIDGFGNLREYYSSGIVEILEFFGDYYNPETGELMTNRMITVIDRCKVIRDEPIATYSGRAPIRHVGWRKRPDNLYAMGPLDNLVGMQYRIDHLENAKADAFDLAIQPPLVISGEVEQFDWGPSAEIHVDENGKVEELLKNLNAIITSDAQIQTLEDKMELFAGAPREAMGIRTPGEKTALEVQTLTNAAAKIFQEKITTFEVDFFEPILNDMLESAHRNLETSDVIRVIDSDIGVEQFITITKDDITANGVIRPVGARHFAQQAQELQNLIGIFNSPMLQFLAPHTSGKNLSKFVEDITNIRGYKIFRDNVAVIEQLETQELVNQGREDLAVQQQTPAEGTSIPNKQEMLDEQPV